MQGAVTAVLHEIDVATGPGPAPDARFWRSPALGGVECFRARFTTHRYARHWHDGYALGVVVDGAETYFCNGRHWHVAPLRSVIAINPGEVHDGASASPGGWTYRMLYPRPGVLEAVATELTGRPTRPTLRQSAIADPELARTLAIGHAGLEHDPDVLAQDSALTSWLAALLRRHADLQVTGAPPLAATDARLEAVRERLDAAPEAAPTLDELAQAAGIGPFHLLRSFGRAYGMTPHAWLVQRRVLTAKQLIDRGATLADAAMHAGFCDQSHLTNRFRRAYGVTPSQYRRARG